MKIKKILALLLACCIVLGLAACGSAESAAAPAESAAEAPAAEAPAADAETSAADAEVPAEGEVIACDPLEITFSTVYNETETGGMLIKHFEEYLSKITDGAQKALDYSDELIFKNPETSTLIQGEAAAEFTGYDWQH